MHIIDLSPLGIKVLCDYCQGSGSVPEDDGAGDIVLADCPRCHGRGSDTPENAALLRPHEVGDLIASLRQESERLAQVAAKLEQHAHAMMVVGTLPYDVRLDLEIRELQQAAQEREG